MWGGHSLCPNFVFTSYCANFAEFFNIFWLRGAERRSAKTILILAVQNNLVKIIEYLDLPSEPAESLAGSWVKAGHSTGHQCFAGPHTHAETPGDLLQSSNSL